MGGSGRKFGAAIDPGCTLNDCRAFEGVPCTETGFDVGDAIALSGERLISWLNPEEVLLPPVSAGRARETEVFLGEGLCESSAGLRSLFSLPEDAAPSSGESRALMFIARIYQFNQSHQKSTRPVCRETCDMP